MTKEKIKFGEGIWVVDIPEGIKEKIAQPSLDFDSDDINYIRTAKDDESFDSALWETYKREKLIKIGTDSVTMAEVFIFCHDFLNATGQKLNGEIKKKIDFYLAQFDEMNVLRDLIEQYGDGTHYGSHLIRFNIQRTIRNKRKEILDFINFVTNQIMSEESEGSGNIEPVSEEKIEELIIEKEDFIEESDSDYEVK
jgi:hypothetical protein